MLPVAADTPAAAGNLAAAGPLDLASCFPRLDVAIERLVDHCGDKRMNVSCDPVPHTLLELHRETWGRPRPEREQRDLPQILHEVADGTCDFFVFVERERYHWLCNFSRISVFF